MDWIKFYIGFSIAEGIRRAIKGRKFYQYGDTGLPAFFEFLIVAIIASVTWPYLWILDFLKNK